MPEQSTRRHRTASPPSQNNQPDDIKPPVHQGQQPWPMCVCNIIHSVYSDNQLLKLAGNLNAVLLGLCLTIYGTLISTALYQIVDIMQTKCTQFIHITQLFK